MLGTGVASAHGLGFGLGGGASSLTPDEIATRQQTMFDKQAQILGISASDVKDAWAAGKTFDQIITEKGLDKAAVEQRIKDAATVQMKAQLQALVTKGIITQAQADSRLQFMQTRAENRKGKGMMKGMRGIQL